MSESNTVLSCGITVCLLSEEGFDGCIFISLDFILDEVDFALFEVVNNYCIKMSGISLGRGIDSLDG
jgi:hypothetical protein